MRARDQGFALIEALVALAILGMMLAILFEVAAGSAARVGRVAESRAGLLVARSQLAAVGATIPLAPGITRGVDGALEWSAAIEPAGGLTAIGQPLRVEITVEDGGRRLATLATLRLAPPIAAPAAGVATPPR